MSEFIEHEGHRSWVPLPMDVKPRTLAKELRRRFGPAAGDDEGFELNLAAAQGTATNLQQQAQQLEGQGSVTCAAWLLVRQPDRLDIRAVAILRASAVAPGTSLDQCIEGVIGDAPRHGEPVVEPFDTYAGEAYRIRYRPIVRVEDEDAVHQINAVLWPRLADSVVFLLSTYVENLLEGEEIGDLLDELAAGTRGI